MDAAKTALAYKNADFLFGSMEGGVENPLPGFTEFMKALSEQGAVSKTPYNHLTHPVIIKTPKIRDVAKTSWNISQQLNTGVSGLMFVGVECAKEVQVGLAAMRFKSKGGTRLDNVGIAPQVWGMTEKEYRDKADVWGLGNGELVNWTIVESKKGLENVREIAKVKGIGVLWPGAGTLGGVFGVTKTDGTRGRDDFAWEFAIQQTLAACKEFNVSCGYPVSAAERNADGTTSPGYIEYRRKQGFNVLLFQGVNDETWKAIDLTRKEMASKPNSSK
jgi:2-keto-3-deoxy-L-rhamnonate aldolase RhmA